MAESETGQKINAFFKQHKVLAWGGIAVGGIAAVIIYRRKAAKQAANAGTTAGQGTDPAGNVGQIDPQTGFVVGSPEDTQALQQAQGGYYGTGYDPYASGYGISPNTSGGGGSTGGGGGKHEVTTNEEWFRQAQRILPNGRSAAVENALSRILGGLTVTWSQRALFLEAVGILGPPPGGYPKPIKVSHAGGDHDTEGGGGSHARVKVPHVAGDIYAVAAGKIIAVGLRPHAEPKPEGTVAFEQPEAGTEVRRGSAVILHMEGR